MSVLFQRMTVLGLGLLGGSTALAARATGVVGEIVGFGRRERALAQAKEAGIVDRFSLDPQRAVEGADFVVLAVPVSRMEPLLRQVAGKLQPGVLLTDVGSVKGVLAQSLPPLLPDGASYIGSHPMAGSHLRGVEYARANLFRGAACVVCAGPGVAPENVERLGAFWEALGARVYLRDALRHDEQVAWVSHLPHLLAFAFSYAFRDAPQEAQDLVGSGFYDFTRIARSDAAMWGEILFDNRAALRGPLETMRGVLDRFARELESGGIDGLTEHLASLQTVFEAVDSKHGFFAGRATSDLGA